jgi:hypothetical protein
MVKKLIKKLILVLHLGRLTVTERIKKMTDVKNAHKAYPALVPNLDPPIGEVETKLTNLNSLIDKRASLEEQLRSNTQEIAEVETELEDIFVSKYATQTQNASDMDADKAKLLGYSIKGETPTEPPSAESVPVIGKINVNVKGEHTLHCHNNETLKVALPPGILRIDIYGQTGGTQPINLTALVANGGGWLGSATRGKLVHKYGNEHLGQVEYYIAVYIDKVSKKPFAQSFVESALLT